MAQIANPVSPKLTDEELYELGMYRCECGVEVYPTGDPTPHCELVR